ncbi:replication factor RFC1 C terminal domain-containing protein [Myxozyma melibiosi]|uniref:Replication factor C subunit 1 n=1 Tax=Myxozyma melibiosi TaxID=54550 RepID=A0ABR1F9G1_9ASCO
MQRNISSFFRPKDGSSQGQKGSSAAVSSSPPAARKAGTDQENKKPTSTTGSPKSAKSNKADDVKKPAPKPAKRLDSLFSDEEEDVKMKKPRSKKAKDDDDDYKDEPAPQAVTISSDDEDATASPKKKKPTAATRKRKQDDDQTARPTKKRAPAANTAAKKEDDLEVLADAPPAKKKFNPAEFAARRAAVNTGVCAELPEGAPNCLAGLAFVFTGILQTLPRDDGIALVKKYGGLVRTAPSRNTNYVVLGEEAGPKKLEVIKKLGIKTIDENELFELIKTRPANGGDTAEGIKAQKKAAEEEKKIIEMSKTIGIPEPAKAVKASSSGSTSSQASRQTSEQVNKPPRSLLWTDKYAPRSIKDICGNKGAVQKLQKWLEDWPANLKANFKRPGPDGSGVFRAVMISGPPGIGKTTAAHLVAELAGFDVIETNASDTRSKNVIAEALGTVLDNKSIAGYFGETKQDVDAAKRKIVLIMDEVDGTSAGDRGGAVQMSAFCKTTHVPLILICNDYSLQKMRTFDRTTFNIQFRRPDANAIRSRILSIAYREGLKIPAPVIDQLVQSTHADIRQIITLLSTFSLGETGRKEMSFEQGQRMAQDWQKHIVMKPFDIASKLLNGEMFGARSRATLNDKIELYFNDADMSPLMVQENYLRTRPAAGANKVQTLTQLDRAASSISDSDLVDRMIHGSQQQWSLMPLHGVLSTVRPASFVANGGSERFMFTSWLGNYSKGNKLSRYLQEIQSHARLRISGDAEEVRTQYLSSFFDNLYTPIATRANEGGVEDAIKFMDEYYLTKEDFDAVLELGVGPKNGEELWKKIPTATKTAFTRKYNTGSHPVPFIRASTVTDPRKVKKEVPDLEEAMDDVLGEEEEKKEEENEEEEEEDTDLSKDKYIKKPKASAKASSKATAKAPAKAPAKGKGKAKK